MTDYLTRVALQGGTPADYDTLDRAMAAANFSKTIRSARGLTYNMPSGTYHSQAANLSAANVRDLAVAAARQTGKRYDIVTSAGETAFALHPW